ncbi:hypothetical protein GCM10010399_40600 [Dactylosporangium fulvum]|uniref:Uncharacterized protein n=1 Tax=Dactylosporangium fulvum TaxID=53359 RepID=A0ABY5W6I9_9ACTN|nr:hypothetical protein [Dactylosporangium fulvum]UWP84313.1 hypothetical protein Dfulv_08770 [Dactylosporangium fulvum]
MNDLFTPPAERDLPPGRAAEMRAELLAGIIGPARPAPWTRRRVRAAVALAGVVAAAAAGVSAWSGDDGRQVLALGPGELSPSLRPAVEHCLEWAGNAHGVRSLTTDDLVVGAQSGDHTAVLFLTEDRYFACDLWTPWFQGVSGGTSTDTDGEEWRHDWLPGPVERLSMTSTDADGGEVVVVGRVSARVHRLVLDHGNGTRTPARIANGAFGLISEDGDVRWADNPELVSYDGDGKEIDRRSLLAPFRGGDRCYTDPTGAVVLGKPGPACLPAEPWVG